MDQLEWCLHTYEELLGRNFILTLETGEQLIIAFQKEHFHHLLGLHKLNDLDLVNTKHNSVSKIYKTIATNRVDEHYLKKSVHFQSMKDRFMYFPFISSLLTGQVIVNFNPSLVDHTKLTKVKYILFQKVKDGYIHLALGVQEDGIVFPVTFFFETGKQYITGQTILNIIESKVINFRNME